MRGFTGTAGAAAAVVLVLVVGCAGPETVEDLPEVAGVDQAQDVEQGPVVADPVAWDAPITVEGVGGGLEVAPHGLRYVTAEEISSPTDHDHPSRGVFAVVRFTVTTDGDSASVPRGWGWRQDGQEYGPGDGGNASMAPWMGTIPEVHSETVLLGGDNPTVGYATFDLPERGGELTFTDAAGSMVRWTAPDQDHGEVPELVEWFAAR